MNVHKEYEEFEKPIFLFNHRIGSLKPLVYQIKNDNNISNYAVNNH